LDSPSSSPFSLEKSFIVLFDLAQNQLYSHSHVLAEFFHIDGLVCFFVKMLFDLAQQVTAMTGAFAGDPLNVFGVNAESVHPFLVLLLVRDFVRIF
jgi:hypothetical protein